MPQRRGTMPISDADIVYSPDTYSYGVPHEILARLRARTPVTWIEGRATGGPGLWVVLRHADARRVLHRPSLFSTGDHVPHENAEPGGGRPADPAQADVDARVGALLDRVTAREPADFVADAAGRLPGTLRDALAGGLYALLRHPEQYTRLREADHRTELLDSAVEEMLRWWTPVLHVRRWVRRNTAVGGVPVRGGERLAVWLVSADHDEDAFADPGRFDVGRRPNHHLAFGHRPRHCPGARTVRAHLRALLAGVLERPGRLELAGEPMRLRSNARNGFAHLPVRWSR